MNKFKSKKGFTLAELLIVVAIIAVLVAIAVPLFVSGLSKAQKARDDANVHAVKSAAVVYILNAEESGDDGSKIEIFADADDTGSGIKKGDLHKYFKVTATIADGGEIKINTILGQDAAYTTTDEGVTAAADGGWTVIAYLAPVDFATA